MHKKVLGLLLLTILIVSTGCASKQTVQGKSCQTKYPILLVHGFMYRDDVPIMDYWGDNPALLREQGAEVYFGNLKAVCSLEENAAILKKTILAIVEKTGKQKVNIIAHSKGGLESRYLISQLDMADHVASLTTLSTPHRGSKVVDYIVKVGPLNNPAFMFIFNFYGSFIGDDSSNATASFAQMNTAYLREFNQKNLDSPKVYYRSYGATLSNKCPNLLWKSVYKILEDVDGPNDGLVSLTSAQWGDYKGSLNDLYGYPSISHVDMVGINWASTGNFDPHPFFLDMVQELVAKGF